MLGVKTIEIPKDKGISLHASSEDLMIMMSLLKPKYIIPVKADYRYMVGNANLADNLGYKKEDIILKLNGEVINIVDKKLKPESEKIFIDDILMMEQVLKMLVI